MKAEWTGAPFRTFRIAALAAVLVLAMAVQSVQSQKSEESLQIGGLVTLDHVSGLNVAKDPALGLGEVALGAHVAVSPELQASVQLLAEGDLQAIAFDQALAALAPRGTRWTLLFGQQTFNHGLLSTRLISDPEILGPVELLRPGVTAAYARGGFGFGLGLLALETPLPDALSRDHALVSNLDAHAGPLLLRISGLLSRYRSDLDLAGTLECGRLLLDMEAFHRLPLRDTRGRDGGWSLGAAYRLSPALALAARQDGLTSRNLARLHALRHGAGLTLLLKHGLFAAGEYAYRHDHEDGGDGGRHHLALQIGLKSTLELPGFQRKTLTQD